jgi:hypothetical protein
MTSKYSNPCRRHVHSWHQWRVFEAKSWSGEVAVGSDASRAHWFSRQKIGELADITNKAMKRLNVSEEDLRTSTRALSDDSQWISNPGIEPVWLVILRRLGIVP